MSETKVLRTFFVNPGVDAELSRIALKNGISKNELTRKILEQGMRPFLNGKKIPPGLRHGNASDAGEGRDLSMVMRSIYLAPQFDKFLRDTAFSQNYSKSELMRHFIKKELPNFREKTIDELNAKNG